MAFKAFKTKRKPITLDTMAQRIARRRAEIGDFEFPRNSSKNRTPSKRVLLKEIKDTGGEW